MAFLIAAAVAVLVAVFFVVKPLVSGSPERARLRRQLNALDDLIDQIDPREYTERRRRLRAELAELGGGQPVVVVVTLAMVVPLSAWLLYQHVGEPAGLTPTGEPVEQLRTDLTEIARSLERNPDDAELWARMGMAYKNIGEYSSAQHAFRRSLYIEQNNPPIQVELAETLMFMGDGRGLPDEARQLLTRALTIEPQNRKALWLMGIGAFQAGDYDHAIVWWQDRLLPLLAEGTPLHDTIVTQIAQARFEMGQDPGELAALRQAPPLAPGESQLPPGHPPIDQRDAPTVPTPETPTTQSDLEVDITIDPQLVNALSGDETVFVIARAADGPSTPLAVRRMTVADLPARLTLNDRDAMVEGMDLSSFPEVVITARVSMSGGVDARPGDFQGQTDVVSISEIPSASLTISERL